MSNLEKNLLEPIPIVRALFLLLIKKYPNSTGYDLMSYVSEFTHGKIKLQTGTVYGELRRLEKSKLLVSKLTTEGRKKRCYEITDAGKEELACLIRAIRFRIDNLLEPLIKLYDEIFE